MKVINKASFPVIAFGWDTRIDYGDDVRIEPGHSAEVLGPYLGEMGGGDCHIALLGSDIICHDGPDEGDSFHISEGNQINLQEGTHGITIRHYAESRTVDLHQ